MSFRERLLALRGTGVGKPTATTGDAARAETSRSHGEALLELVENQPEWVHRRVERLVIEDTGECTRHVSLDFTVRPERRVPGSSDRRVLVPLGVLRKGALRGFDVRGPAEKPLPFLGKHDNSELALQLLTAAAQRHRPTDEALSAFTTLVQQVVEAPPTDNRNDETCQQIRAVVESVVTTVVDVVEVDASSDEDRISLLRSQLCSLVEKYIDGFLMVVEVDSEVIGQRSLIKFSFREPVYDWSPKGTTWDVNDFVMARSTHFELAPPPLLEVEKAQLIGFSADGKAFELDTHLGKHTTLHLVGAAADRYVSATVSVKLMPRSFGAYSAAFWGPFALALTVLAGVVVRRLRADMPTIPERVSSGLPTIMLAASGLLLTWVARSPEDWTTAKILRPARYVLWCAAGLCVAIAAFLALPFGGPWRTYGWLLGLLLALALLIVAWVVHGKHHKYRSGLGFAALLCVSVWAASYALDWDLSQIITVLRDGWSRICRSEVR